MDDTVVITKEIRKFVVILPIHPDVMSKVSARELQDWAVHEMLMKGEFASGITRTVYRGSDNYPEPWPEGVPTDYVLYRYEALLVPRGDVDGHP